MRSNRALILSFIAQLINVLRGLSLSLVERTKRVETRVDDLVRDATQTNVMSIYHHVASLPVAPILRFARNNNSNNDTTNNKRFGCTTPSTSF
jgi:hypothetical protein